MSTERPRPPSVERVLAAVRPRLGEDVAPDAVAAVARDVVDGERDRLAAGEAPTTLDALAADVEARLDGFTDVSGSRLTSVLNATGGCTQPRARAVGQGRHRGRDARGVRLFAARIRP